MRNFTSATEKFKRDDEKFVRKGDLLTIGRKVYDEVDYEKAKFYAQNGFNVDKENDVLIKNGKAFCSNIPGKFKNMYELLTFIKNNPNELKKFAWIIDMLGDGYKMEIGEALPVYGAVSVPEMSGVYCKNYREMARKEAHTQQDVGDVIRSKEIKDDVSEMFGEDVTHTAVEEAMRKALEEKRIKIINKYIKENEVDR